ncbi:response regulator transcription factor [Nocardia huaxiensis]|uniref:response regulator transcription factor n=1 Tax=Nocardia huaxiensis TaxID=2755382 RepID=UPI001E6314A5|nr:response regulator transcription factor [Nocardia huaxiensis]UFS97489.1 response regulator transcription factor [Nocardia huaxiensis]
MNASGVKVVVAEDSVLIRDSVVRALATDPAIEVAGAAADFDSTLDLVRRHRPDVLITDVRMPPTGTDEGVRLARELRATHPGIGVIVLTHYAEPAYATALLDGGSAGRGYLLKERIARFDQLLNAVHVVAGGGSVLDPIIMEALLPRHRGADPMHRLTARELQVLGEIALGGSNQVVAQRLALSQRAVQKHINSIFAKLGITLDPALDQRVTAVLMFLAAQPR